MVLVQLGCLVRAESRSRVRDKPAASHVTVGLGASFCHHCASDTGAGAAFLWLVPTIAQRANVIALPRPDRELLGDATHVQLTLVRS